MRIRRLSPWWLLALVVIPWAGQGIHRSSPIDRTRQKRTMADMRDLAIAIESYNTDNNYYPPASCALGGSPSAIGSGSFALLRPTYIADPPTHDGWGNFFLYDNGPGGNGQSYDIVSLGRDGVFQGPVVCGTTTNFNDDIVYENGTFVQWPGGPQE
jgi:Type II secretion system (T2SS), protein G